MPFPYDNPYNPARQPDGHYQLLPLPCRLNLLHEWHHMNSGKRYPYRLFFSIKKILLLKTNPGKGSAFALKPQFPE
jgi:hypothetical protein